MEAAETALKPLHVLLTLSFCPSGAARAGHGANGPVTPLATRPLDQRAIRPTGRHQVTHQAAPEGPQGR
eukprot:15442784-Alexandrium_andersonii.AAC.1